MQEFVFVLDFKYVLITLCVLFIIGLFYFLLHFFLKSLELGDLASKIVNSLNDVNYIHPTLKDNQKDFYQIIFGTEYCENKHFIIDNVHPTFTGVITIKYIDDLKNIHQNINNMFTNYEYRSIEYKCQELLKLRFQKDKEKLKETLCHYFFDE